MDREGFIVSKLTGKSLLCQHWEVHLYCVILDKDLLCQHWRGYFYYFIIDHGGLCQQWLGYLYCVMVDKDVFCQYWQGYLYCVNIGNDIFIMATLTGIFCLCKKWQGYFACVNIDMDIFLCQRWQRDFSCVNNDRDIFTVSMLVPDMYYFHPLMRGQTKLERRAVCVRSPPWAGPAEEQLAERSPKLDVKDGVNERVDGGGGVSQPQGHISQDCWRSTHSTTRYNHQVHDEEGSPTDHKCREDNTKHSAGLLLRNCGRHLPEAAAEWKTRQTFLPGVQLNFMRNICWSLCGSA